MRSIAVCNLKGGVGKTTTTVNLGACLARNGKRVLLIDCDPQGSLTHWLRIDPDPGEPTLYEVLRGSTTVAGAARETRWENLSVVPSTPRLAEIDRGALAGERVLWARMASDFDYVLMDCGASHGVVLCNALTAADEILAPVQAKGMALGGLARLERLIAKLAERTRCDVELTGILVCLFDARTRISRLVLGQLRARYRSLVFDTLIHENVRLAESADRRKPISWYAPDSRGAAEYAALAFEVTGRERRRTRRDGRDAAAAGGSLRSARPRLTGTAAVGAHHATPSSGPASRS